MNILNVAKQYTFEDYIFMTIVLVAVIKGSISMFDWLKNRFFNKTQEDALSAERARQEFAELKGCVQHLVEEMKDLKQDVRKIRLDVDDLIQSDKEDIKAFITNRYRYFAKTLGYIDEFSLNAIEVRYARYKKEGGNTFVDDLMTELRKIPRHTSKGSNE
jgi:hypothetical protein